MNNNKKLQAKIDKMLIELKITPALSGFYYIKECVMMTLMKGGKVGGLFREMYRQIASEYSTSPSSVERAIRNALDNIWKNARAKTINKVIGLNLYTQYDKPSITQFITLLAEKISQEYYIADNGEIMYITIR